MKRFTILSILACLFLIPGQAQVNKKVVAELFTNTRCSICAARIPGFKQNLEAHPEVMVITVHPSSPYSNCFLHQHNSLENDARTNHYNIYGGTPRLVVQGQVVSGSNLSNASIFSGQLNQTTPFSLKVKEIRRGMDSVSVEVTVFATEAHSVTGATIFAAYVEDTLAYNAPNGETEHWGVFRKAFSTPEGTPLTLPANGDSVMWSATIAVNQEWNMDDMQVMVILSDQLKLVLQSESTTSVETVAATSIGQENLVHFSISPNPVQGAMEVDGVSGSWSVFSIDGKAILRGSVPRGEERVEINLGNIPEGIYLFENQGSAVKFMKR